MASEIHSIVGKRIQEAGHRLRQDKIEPWLFLKSGKLFQVVNFYGKTISYQGIEFEGSPRDVFWGHYIEPFIEEIVDRVINDTAQEAIERHVAVEPAIRDAERYLKQLVRVSYDKMAEVDQRLRGNGYPSSVSRRSIDAEVSVMEAHITQRAAVEIKASKQQRGFSGLYNRHPFLFWAIGMVITIALGIMATIKN